VKTHRFLIAATVCLMTTLSWAAPSQEQAPRIMVTIKPVHAIVSAMLKGVARPGLLLEGFHSPHTYHLKPSDAQRLYEADAIIWVGPSLEGYLAKVIERQRGKALVITLLESTHDDAATHRSHARHETDPHIWLDPQQVIRLLPVLQQQLSGLMPQQADTIRANTGRLIQRLNTLDQSIATQFEQQKAVAAIAYHDAWHYFVQRYGLKTEGVISTHEQQQPGAAHLHEIQQRIGSGDIRCLLIEPQFKPRYLNTLIGDQPVRLIRADPLGSQVKAGPEAYFDILNNVSQAFAQCLRD